MKAWGLTPSSVHCPLELPATSRSLEKKLAGADSGWCGWCLNGLFDGFWMASHRHIHQTFQSRVGEGLHLHSGFVLLGVHQGNLESYESYIYLWYMQTSKLYRHHFGLLFVAHWMHFPTPLILSLGQMACLPMFWKGNTVHTRNPRFNPPNYCKLIFSWLYLAAPTLSSPQVQEQARVARCPTCQRWIVAEKLRHHPPDLAIVSWIPLCHGYLAEMSQITSEHWSIPQSNGDISSKPFKTHVFFSPII